LEIKTHTLQANQYRVEEVKGINCVSTYIDQEKNKMIYEKILELYQKDKQEGRIFLFEKRPIVLRDNSGYPEKSIIPKREAEPLSHKDSLQHSSG
jgi:hypothetical protein